MVDPPVRSMKRARLLHAPPIERKRVTGFVSEMMKLAGVKLVRVPCFLYQRKEDLGKALPERAREGDSLVLYAHGGAYWGGRGTA